MSELFEQTNRGVRHAVSHGAARAVRRALRTVLWFAHRLRSALASTAPAARPGNAVQNRQAPVPAGQQNAANPGNQTPAAPPDPAAPAPGAPADPANQTPADPQAQDNNPDGPEDPGHPDGQTPDEPEMNETQDSSHGQDTGDYPASPGTDPANEAPAQESRDQSETASADLADPGLEVSTELGVQLAGLNAVLEDYGIRMEVSDAGAGDPGVLSIEGEGLTRALLDCADAHSPDLSKGEPECYASFQEAIRRHREGPVLNFGRKDKGGPER